ncbi:MAG TPA: ATP-binding protein [Acidimicrobiales bacterium]|nr:ATP-binding protein [Acidimicrobiales bacterium]
MSAPVLVLSLPNDVRSPERARRAIESWLAGYGAPAGSVANAVAVVNELVTNGVLHASGVIDLRAEVEGDALFIEVATAPAAPDEARVARPEPSESGRGFTIVGACCDVVDIRDDPSGFRHVICTIALR